ncbi:MAG: tryptophan--tRNA ligase [Coriobacteriaceae bacterium]|jgi:tryptophanyl-tRNA synthetase|nr:tryptophan--tRNA ligase [Coriobacteriaceae bacterium]
MTAQNNATANASVHESAPNPASAPNLASASNPEEIILTGYRPTGKMHLGHWFGNLQNMLALQHDYEETYYFVADWHALTSDWADPSHLTEYTEEMVLDWCAAGMNPEKSIIYRQSDIPQIAELNIYFALVTPMGWLERVPTYKEQRDNIQDKDLSNVGFFQYPMLQGADIAIMRATKVPVGEDQLPHLEISREIVRRFNYTYGNVIKGGKGEGEDLVVGPLVEPQALIASAGARVPGLDGRKMSKSYNNALFISDDEETLRKKAMSCITDPARKLKTDAGDPDICPLHQIHKLVGEAAVIAEFDVCCRNASCGCVAHKKKFAEDIVSYLAPFREKRAELAAIPNYAKEVLVAGGAKARPKAEETIRLCRDAMKITL